jgi:hypothetical protein
LLLAREFQDQRETSSFPNRDFARLAKFPAGFDINIDRIMKSLVEIGDIVGVKADDIADACKPAEKNPILGIEFDPSGIAFVGHDVDGSILNSSKYRRKSLILYRLASLSACGRRKKANRPSFSNRTREPLPFTILQPTASKCA